MDKANEIQSPLVRKSNRPSPLAQPGKQPPEPVRLNRRSTSSPRRSPSRRTPGSSMDCSTAIRDGVRPTHSSVTRGEFVCRRRSTNQRPSPASTTHRVQPGTTSLGITAGQAPRDVRAGPGVDTVLPGLTAGVAAAAISPRSSSPPRRSPAADLRAVHHGVP